MNKYHNKKVECDGHVFDSKAEYRRYLELKLMIRAGVISNLELQPRFELQPKFKKGKTSYRKIEYVADFKYIDDKGNIIIEDVKGIKTSTFELKKKMFEYKYPELNLILIK